MTLAKLAARPCEELPMDLHNGWELLILGLFLLGGFGAHVFGRRAHVPRVTLLLLIGVLAGPQVFDLVPHLPDSWFNFVTQCSLAFVGFLLGEELASKKIEREDAKVLAGIVTALVVATLVIVIFATRLVGASWSEALLLAAIATATAPAATLDVIHEAGAKGPLTDLVLELVAIDDIVGVLLFSICLTFAEVMTAGALTWSALGMGVWEVGGALLLGAILGVPMARITGALREDDPTLVEAAGFVLLCAGLAMTLEVSYLLACMTMGVVMARRTTHGKRTFHEIDGVSQPFLIVFFVLAGLGLDFDALWAVGGLGVAYILGRALARVVGGWAGARHAPPEIRSRVGWCLFPQAGVALGLALLVEQRMPEVGATILPVVIGATVVFELIGPLLTRRALTSAGEC